MKFPIVSICMILLLVISTSATVLVEEHFTSPTPFPPNGWTQTSSGHCPVQQWYWNSGYAEGKVIGSAGLDGETRLYTYNFTLMAGDQCQIIFLSTNYQNTLCPSGFGVELYRGSTLIWSADLPVFQEWENHLYLTDPVAATASNYRVEWYIYASASGYGSDAHFCLDNVMVLSNNISVQPKSLGRLRVLYWSYN